MTEMNRHRCPSFLAAGALLAVEGGCVDTALEAAEPVPVCVAAGPTGDPAGSVVMVRADLREAGQIYCSGVVIAPTLVLTTLLCAVLPAELDFVDLDDPTRRLAGGFFRYYMGDVDYLESCRTNDGGWAPVDDGSFSARLGERLEASALSVIVPSGGATDSSSVSRIIRSRSESRCWDTLAVLVLDRDLGLPLMTLRLEEESFVGESVTMSGIGVVDAEFARVVLPSRIEDITFETGDVVAPPRSLLLEGPICDFQTGGPITSDDTGASIGLIAFETDFSCEDPEAPTIGTRLAPFRRLLIDAARSASETLRVEAPVDGSGSGWPACR